MKRKIDKYTRILCSLFLFCMAGVLHAQSGTYGDVFVHSGGEMAIHGVNQSFGNGSQAPQPGIVGTERTSPQGYVSFVGTATVSGASDAQHVDGYAKTYETGAFTFPVGDNGVYAPAKVSASAVASPTDAAYYGVNPSSAVTSSLKGGNEPALPSGGAFSATSLDASVTAIDSTEYWDINGATSAEITLTWRASSNIATLTSSNLSSLTIAGWDGSKWVAIASTVDATSILGGASTTTTGSITTDATIVPNSFNVYTLATDCVLPSGTAVINCQ